MTAEQLTVSGDIPHGETTKNVTYFVVDTLAGSVVGNLTLPDAANFASGFSLKVSVPRRSDAYDVGTFNDAGEFVSANFKLDMPGGGALPTGARGALS